MEKVCPFCGREEKPMSSNSEDHCHWVGEYADKLERVRSTSCYETQLAQQAEQINELKGNVVTVGVWANNFRKQVEQQADLLGRALNFAIIVKNYPLSHEGELVYSIDDINNEAKTLIPDLETALEKAK